MTLAEILASLFPGGHEVQVEGGLITGEGPLAGGGRIHALGIAEGIALGIDEALELAGNVLTIARCCDGAPILLLIDSGSQRMSKRDELLGLNEYLAHLAKALILAELAGHRTVSLLYGHTAAGAFVATGLATSVLIALPDAMPSVMDLPSMARVTKLPVQVLRQKAEATPVFAPGLDNLTRTGAVLEVWSDGEPLDVRLGTLLKAPAERGISAEADMRDQLGGTRKGRSKAAAIAARVAELAIAGA